MAGLSDLIGRHGALEQLFLYGLLAEVVRNEFSPFFTALAQDASASHPLVALPADLAAQAVARRFLTYANGEAEAAKSGLDKGRFATMAKLAEIRVPPADLATGVLRSYVSHAEALTQAEPQGWTPEMFTLLVALSGDAPGPQQLGQAVRRGIIPRAGRGAAAVSFDQGIAESRLHDKYAEMLYRLSEQLLSAPDAASAVIRNFGGRAEMEAIAAKQGIDAATFAIMTHLAGDAPGPQQLAEALRRGVIKRDGTGPGSTSFLQGIAEGRLSDKWAGVIEELAKLWPSPTDALTAQLKGQLTPERGKALYERLGGDPQFMGWLLDTIGDSPTPLEAAIMAARGVIKWDGTGPSSTSYAQAVKESRYKDKWAEVYKHLAEHIPPPSTIVSLYAHRQVDRDTAVRWMAENDVRPDVIPAYIGEADYEAVSDYRGLTSQAVIGMYANHLLTRDQAKPILGVLHVSDAAADLMLDYADMRYLIDSVNRSVQRIAQLYTGRKIGAQAAKDALLKLEIPAATVDQILTEWEIQAQANVKTLTMTEIVDAWYYGVFDEPTAMAELGAIGYTPYDAWVVLSLKAKGPLPGAPPRTYAPPPPAVIPGVA